MDGFSNTHLCGVKGHTALSDSLKVSQSISAAASFCVSLGPTGVEGSKPPVSSKSACEPVEYKTTRDTSRV